MNNILNKCINSDLINIVGLYLLPFVKNVEIKNNYLNELYNKTLNIRWNLKDNSCNDDFGVCCNNLRNTRIRYIKGDTKFWTIRNIKYL